MLCRFLVRFGIEGGGYGNQIFISQCQAVARLFRALVRSSSLPRQNTSACQIFLQCSYMPCAGASVALRCDSTCQEALLMFAIAQPFA